jgi:hypothetical protein
MKKFISDHLDQVRYPSHQQKTQELWDVEGLLKDRSNQLLKFDLRPIIEFKKMDYGKSGFFKSKADKMVFDIKSQWVLIDVSEMHSYLKSTGQTNVSLTELVSKLDWNIILSQ